MCTTSNECDVNKGSSFSSNSCGGKQHPLMSVRSFVKGSSVCAFKVAYLTKNGPRVINNVYSKATVQECNVYHSSLNAQDYCYFYINLFKSSVSPLSGGFLGSHITFGPQKNGKFYLHNTEYEIHPNGTGIGKRTVCWYVLEENINTPVKERIQCESKTLIRMWKTVACSQAAYGGTPGKRKRTPTYLPTPLAPSKKSRNDMLQDTIFFVHIEKDGRTFDHFVNEYHPTMFDSNIMLFETSTHFCAIENAFDDLDTTMMYGGDGKVFNPSTKRYTMLTSRVGKRVLQQHI